MVLIQECDIRVMHVRPELFQPKAKVGHQRAAVESATSASDHPGSAYRT